MANSVEELGGRRHFDFIVVGCGGIGSGAVYWLAKRAGHNVLGLERFKLGHVNGGSQDVSRIIRLTYDDEKYLHLAPHSYTAWREVEKESGMQLVHTPGMLNIARKDEGSEQDLMKYANAMRASQIPFEMWSSEQLRERYPQFTVGSDHVAMWQKDGGLVDAALGNTLHISLAQGRGAKVLDNCPVNRISRMANGHLEVATPKGIFSCKKVVVAAGAWINHVISSLGCHVPVYVTEENVTYFASPHIKEFTKEKFPIFIYHDQSGKHLYGLPAHVIGGTKIGVDAGGPVVSGDNRSFKPDPAREGLLIDTCKKILPKFLGPILETKSCLYTMTPDRHFMIDTCHKTGFPDVVVCCGAGHAFKFASVLGKILSELAVDGKTQYNISGFTWDRESLTNPDFQPTCFDRYLVLKKSKI